MSEFKLDFSTGLYSEMSTPVESINFPDVLHYSAVYQDIAHNLEHTPILGVSGAGELSKVDLDHDSPHILLSAGTGGGKSTVARSILAQQIYHGGVGVILDVKRSSHRWAYNLPNVGYAKSLPEIGNALVELGKEVHRRNVVAEHHPGPIEDAPVGPRIVVCFEELMATMSQLRELTRRTPTASYDAMDALNDILMLGRAVKVSMLGVMQFPDYRILSQAHIEQFTARVMIRYTKNAWVKIAWDCGLPQAAPSQAGRGMIVYGGKARETQFLTISEEEAAALCRVDRNAVPTRVRQELTR